MRLAMRAGAPGMVAVIAAVLAVAGCGSNPAPTAASPPAPTVTVTAPTPKPTPTVTVTAQSSPYVAVPVPGPTVTVPAAMPYPDYYSPYSACMRDPNTTYDEYQRYRCGMTAPSGSSGIWAWEQLVTPVPDGTGRTHISTEPNVTSPVVTTVYPGTSVAVVCKVRGYDVDGRSINWDKVTSPAVGWMADMYLQGSPPPDC